ncbi:MAG TPA: IclR family transcriptional regulator C-terminal domain-containing protein [Streptosporangiaceae bacterium]
MPKLGDSDLSAESVWWADMLARKTGMAVWIGELVGDKVQIVHQGVRPEFLVQILGGDGTLPWHACAIGQAIVAHLDYATQEALLAAPAQRLTGLTITDPGALRKMLAVTRDRGYAVEAHAATLGDAGIAAPVFTTSEQVIGAIGIVGPAEFLLSPERQQELAGAVCATAQSLSQEMGSAGATTPGP